METFTFDSSAQFLEWVEGIVKEKSDHFNRVPIPEQVWTYNGCVEKTRYGLRGGTMLSNFGFIQRTATGNLSHKKERRIVENIDHFGGVTLTIRWREQVDRHDL